METENTNNLSERKIVLAVMIMVIACLFMCGWFLGNQRAAEKYQAELVQLRAENSQLTSDIAAWKEKAQVNQSVSAKTAMKVLHAKYPADSQLVALEYPFSDCDRFSYYQKIEDWQIPFTEKAFVMKWDGIITAGIDMSEVSISTNKAGDKLIVTIPSTKILSFTIDEDSFQLLEEQNNLFNPISVEDMMDLDIQVEEQLKNRAIDNSLLRTAQSNVKLLITDALRSDPSIGSFYEIDFKIK